MTAVNVKHQGCAFLDEENMFCLYYEQEEFDIGHPLFICPMLPHDVQFGYIDFMLFDVLWNQQQKQEGAAA